MEAKDLWLGKIVNHEVYGLSIVVEIRPRIAEIFIIPTHKWRLEPIGLLHEPDNPELYNQKPEKSRG